MKINDIFCYAFRFLNAHPEEQEAILAEVKSVGEFIERVSFENFSKQVCLLEEPTSEDVDIIDLFDGPTEQRLYVHLDKITHLKQRLLPLCLLMLKLDKNTTDSNDEALRLAAFLSQKEISLHSEQQDFFLDMNYDWNKIRSLTFQHQICDLINRNELSSLASLINKYDTTSLKVDVCDVLIEALATQHERVVRAVLNVDDRTALNNTISRFLLNMLLNGSSDSYNIKRYKEYSFKLKVAFNGRPHSELILSMLDCVADLCQKRSPKCDTAISLAFDNRWPDVIRILMEENAPPPYSAQDENKNANRANFLTVAMLHDDYDLVVTLCEQGFKTSETDFFMPMNPCVPHNTQLYRPEVYKDPLFKPDVQRLVLCEAIKRDKDELALQLIQDGNYCFGEDTSEYRIFKIKYVSALRRCYPLAIAIQHGKLEIIKALLQKSEVELDVLFYRGNYELPKKIRHPEGRHYSSHPEYCSAITMAVELDRPDIALLLYSTRPEIFSYPSTRDVIDQAVVHGMSDFMLVLLDNENFHKVDSDSAFTESFRTCSHEVVITFYIKMRKFLLAKDRANNFSKTPYSLQYIFNLNHGMECAIKHKREDIAQSLIQYSISEETDRESQEFLAGNLVKYINLCIKHKLFDLADQILLYYQALPKRYFSPTTEELSTKLSWLKLEDELPFSNGSAEGATQPYLPSFKKSALSLESGSGSGLTRAPGALAKTKF